MDRLISYFLALAVAAGLMFAWDRHPPLGWHAHVLWWRPGFDLPDSLATQRDRALRAAGEAQAGEKRCLVALGSQNAAISSLSARSEAALAEAEQAVKAAKGRADDYRQAASDLRRFTPKGPDACSRWEDADRAVEGALR